MSKVAVYTRYFDFQFVNLYAHIKTLKREYGVLAGNKRNEVSCETRKSEENSPRSEMKIVTNVRGETLKLFMHD